MASTYLTRTPSSSGSNTTWTFSAWIKRSALGLDTVPFATGYTSPQIDESMINIGADDQLRFNINVNDTTDVTVQSARKLRDTSGWYHIVVACDTTQATASDRIKIYFNGELETNLSNTDYPTQNQSTFFGDTNKTQEIGRQPRSSNYFDGSMSHVHFTDGTAYDASAFGETDANGVWTINTSPSVTYGTNGFFILKNSGSVTDQSGNGNNWTVSGGTLTDTLDCSANVFATMNSLVPSTNITFSNGNNRVTGSQADNYNQSTISTLGASSGKWYCEAKYTTANANQNPNVGIATLENFRYDVNNTGASGFANVRFDGQVYVDGTAGTATYWGSNPVAGDIIMFALDMDNGKFYLGKNGTWENSGDPTSGSTGTGSITSSLSGTQAFNVRYLASVFDFNFGNGYFGTTAVASAGTNASGNGIFEYDVPTGYTALCTKGLNGE